MTLIHQIICLFLHVSVICLILLYHVGQSMLHDDTVISTASHERLHQRLQQQFQGRNLLNFSQCHRPMNFRRTLNLVFFFARAEDTTLSKTCLVRILSAAEHSMKVCPLTSLHKSNPSPKVTWSTSLDSLISTWVATKTMSCFFLRFLMEGIQNSLTFLNDSRSTTL